MRVFYAEANFGEDEINAALSVLQNSRLSLMGGSQCAGLEREVARLFGKPYGLMTNSGSSANLLGIKALDLPLGTKVLTPALTFSTTVAPLVQAGLVPVFVDVDPLTLQMDTKILNSVNPADIGAMCVPNLIGNVANWPVLADFAHAHGLVTIEDSADTIGYLTDGKIDNFADVSTTSFYASHVVTGAGFGGAVAFKNEQAFNRAKSLRSWGRRSSQYGETEDFDRRFSCKVDGIDYDDKYVFDDLGYNLIPSEISAAFASVQLKKLDKNIKNRWDNFQKIKNGISNFDGYQTFDTYEGIYTGWLAFPLLLKGNLIGRRKKLQIFLEERGVQTRTIFTGNIMRQPVARKFKWEKIGSFECVDNIMENGILLGCHNRMTEEKIGYLLDLLTQFHE